MLIFLVFLMWVEVGGYIDGFVDHQFTVDNETQAELRINVDLIVATPCNYINTNVRDATADLLMAAEKLSYEGVGFFVPPWYVVNGRRPVRTTELDEIVQRGMPAEFIQREQQAFEGQPACHIFGSFPVNKVKGEFHITAKGYGYHDRRRPPPEALNFTHITNEFSFGDFYPYLDNPLDETVRVTNEHLHTYQYELNVVPTYYRKLGMEVDTYQFSALNFDKSATRQVPGIFFRYDFEPIKLLIEEKRISFIQFVLRLTTICGGLIVISSWLYQTFDRLLVIAIGKKKASRGEERPHGLLE
ncbi:unnamed protein product [Kuraishia capsulata CBS 1993]|uniref:Endoplasmic reticulum-Golgi intermediate compartment protein n=1 Tax=Kuraishia capsulata CBS 1993 TaxID=1382522 RepID=W6MLY0_9ASCO|nr:uncharacterized protein KUCA_T00001873001 [Kuraishia capsulata CBS 1993]CDK25902.1 unnamed protein product [Kuraishia capsulata CBS 1993]